MKYVWNILYYLVIITCLSLVIIEFFSAFALGNSMGAFCFVSMDVVWNVGLYYHTKI